MSESKQAEPEEIGDVLYLDIAKKPRPTTWESIFISIKAIQAYFQAISRRFVERELVIKQMMHAMMMREHIMIDGPTGAAKSMLIECVFSGIKNATIWAMDLSQFTTETQLFGSFDVRLMKETGQFIHMTEGSIAEANFAQTGEFFDANDAALRALLGALNERVVKKGPQLMRLPLLTSIADTNFHPEDLPMSRRKKLAAVIDRFLFRVPVYYVQEPRNRLSMLEMSLDNVHAIDLPPISLEDFVLVSGVVRGMNLLLDPYIIQAYEEMTRLFSARLVKAGRDPLSDRRFVRAAQIMEISAMLQGRKEVAFEDLESTEYVLTHSEEDQEMLDEVRREIIDGWVRRASRREIEAEMHRLVALTSDIPDDPTLAEMPLSELNRLAKQIDTSLEGLKDFKTSSLEVGKHRFEVTKSLIEMRNEVDLRILDAIEASLPEVPHEPQADQLTNLMSQVNTAYARLQRMTPHADVVQIKHIELLERIFADQGKLKVAFDLAGIVTPEEPSEVVGE
jgi:MoxR-like ATPase